MASGISVSDDINIDSTKVLSSSDILDNYNTFDQFLFDNPLDAILRKRRKYEDKSCMVITVEKQQ